MKKITMYIVAFFLCFSLSACSKQVDKNDTLTFFDALHQTFQADSAHIDATIQMDQDDPSTLHADIYFDQTNDLELAITTDLSASGKTENDFLNFYIKDGKTYLDSMGVKTQSVVEKIGLKKNSKLTNLDPFLDMTDEELEKMFTSSRKNGNTYSFEIDKNALSSVLDSYGSVKIDQATVDAVIENNIISQLKLNAHMSQSLNDQAVDTSLTITIKVNEYDSLSSVPFPSDLDSYQKQ